MNYSTLVMIVMMILYLINNSAWYASRTIPELVSVRYDVILAGMVFSVSVIGVRVVQKVVTKH